MLTFSHREELSLSFGSCSVILTYSNINTNVIVFSTNFPLNVCWIIFILGPLTHLSSPTHRDHWRSRLCPVDEWRTVCTGVNSHLMRKSALAVETRPKWAGARAGVNESIKSFNEGEAEMKGGEEKMERWRGKGREWGEVGVDPST